jgi:hypothetical protein
LKLKTELGLLETHYIDSYKSFDSNFGYNMTTGGETYTLSIEARRKISEANKKRGPMSSETRQKISQSHIGLTASEETKKKLSDIRKNKPNSGWFKKGKLPNETSFKKGMIVPREIVEKIRKTRTGKKRGPYRKKFKPMG